MSFMTNKIIGIFRFFGGMKDAFETKHYNPIIKNCTKKLSYPPSTTTREKKWPIPANTKKKKNTDLF